MRIGIDGRTIVKQRTGVGEYSERIVRHLLEHDRTNQYFLFLTEPLDYLNAPNLTKIVDKKSSSMGRNRIWENFILPIFLYKNNVDIYFSPAFTLPILPRIRKYIGWLPMPPAFKYLFNIGSKVRYVVTIHDVIACLYPEYFTLKMRIWNRIFISNAVRIADRILTDSDSTRHDIERLFPGLKLQMLTVYPSIDSKYHTINNDSLIEITRKNLDLPSNFILYLGTIEPRKNVLAIVRAYALLPQQLQVRYGLILCGRLGWLSDPIATEIKALRSQGKIRMIGYVPHEALPVLYNMADLFVFPSFYEGFGLPPLEAMACGVPVITSDVSSLPEVVGNAGIMIDPAEIGQLAEAMEKVLGNEKLRKSMITKGYERVKKFSPEYTASQILRVFGEMEKGKN